MILAMNIGNTSFVVAIRKGENLNVRRCLTAKIQSKLDFINVINRFIGEFGVKTTDFTGAVICSVSPGLTDFLHDVVKDLLGVSPLIVDSYMDMKLDLSNYDTKLIGSDRIAVCEAAISKYSLPAIVFDFGTATTINVIDENNRYLGGSIMSGLMTGINSLAKNTAQLPAVDLEENVNLIGRNTKDCLTSGAIFGNAAMFDGMVLRIEKEIKRKTNVIVTGGYAGFVLPFCNCEHVFDKELLVYGLFELYDYKTQHCTLTKNNITNLNPLMSTTR